MIMVSQDKDNVINYDNVTSLWIDDNVLDKTNTTFYINADEDFLGEYETEERAKEVLQEITEKICEGSNIQMDIEGINCEVSKQIYYMPER